MNKGQNRLQAQTSQNTKHAVIFYQCLTLPLCHLKLIYKPQLLLIEIKDCL